MPRLSVIASACVLATVALSALNAQAAVVVRSIDDLRADPAVAALAQEFQMLAGASVLYDRCAGPYGISIQQQDYVNTKYATVTKAYADSYYTTYYTKVNAPPPQKIVDYYLQYIRDEQQAILTNTNSLIETRGCNKSELRKLYSTMENIRAAEAAAELRKKNPHDPWRK